MESGVGVIVTHWKGHGKWAWPPKRSDAKIVIFVLSCLILIISSFLALLLRYSVHDTLSVSIFHLNGGEFPFLSLLLCPILRYGW
jgi:hypothetical protein